MWRIACIIGCAVILLGFFTAPAMSEQYNGIDWILARDGGYGPGDGTGNDGVGPGDGTGNGPGDCSLSGSPYIEELLARDGGYGPGDGTGNDGVGPGDGTGNGPGDCS